MNPVPLIDPTLATLNPILPRLFALNSHADVGVLGRLRGALRAAGARRSRSRSTRARRGWARCRGRRTRPSTGRRPSPTPTGPATTTRPATRCARARPPTRSLLDLRGHAADRRLRRQGAAADLRRRAGDGLLQHPHRPGAAGRRRHRPAVGRAAGRPAGAAQPDPARDGARCGSGDGHVARGRLLDDPQPARQHARVRRLRGDRLPRLGARASAPTRSTATRPRTACSIAAEFNALTGDDDTTPVYDGDAIGFLVENLAPRPAG